MSEMVDAVVDQSRALRPLALLAMGSTGADIERVVREARGKARRERRSLTWTDIEQALTSQARAPHESMDHQIAIHELGHAIVYIVLGIGLVATVRIGGKGGEVNTRLDVAKLQDEEGLMRLLASTLAGRAAEKLVLGKVHVGSGGDIESDLARATQLAIDAETSLGLGKDMPLVYRPPVNAYDTLNYQQPLLGSVNQRLEAAEVMAVNVLEHHRDTLIILAERLKMDRVLEGDEIVKALSLAGDSQVRKL
jgi:ATP-dependent Zn protease